MCAGAFAHSRAALYDACRAFNKIQARAKTIESFCERQGAWSFMVPRVKFLFNMCINEVLQFKRRFGLGMSRPCRSCVETTSFSTRFLVSRLAQLSQAHHNPFARLDRRNRIGGRAPSPESLNPTAFFMAPVSRGFSSATSATVLLVCFFSPEILWILVPERKSTHLSSSVFAFRVSAYHNMADDAG